MFQLASSQPAGKPLAGDAAGQRLLTVVVAVALQKFENALPVFGLSQISKGQTTAKLLVFGVLAAGDAGKAWVCEDCGSKF